MDDVPTLVRQLALSLIPMVLSLSFHEFAHAAVANSLGDKTAQKQGRLTLNPVSHIDPIGTLLFPILSVVSGGIVFLGWAKPVPVTPNEFREKVPRRLGMALVAMAGPLSNAFIALSCAALMAGLLRYGVAITKINEDSQREVLTPLGTLLFATLHLNIGLCVFNLLPIPPLDGHYLLPKALDRVVVPLKKYGFAVLMLIFMFLPSVANAVFYRPIRVVSSLILSLFGLG